MNNLGRHHAKKMPAELKLEALRGKKKEQRLVLSGHGIRKAKESQDSADRLL